MQFLREDRWAGWYDGAIGTFPASKVELIESQEGMEEIAARVRDEEPFSRSW